MDGAPPHPYDPRRPPARLSGLPGRGRAAGEAVAGRGLDETFVMARGGRTCSLRWVYLAMIQEYARHNGHADLLRERTDGETGDYPRG
ncbi:mycothiol transferase [Streptomyces sp. NBC_00342]|uniref:mycothiol transferase n=1 Tax=Streptomyces sp. NBC_00342 TaxID=2975718 RepID=UPI003FA7AF12